MLTQGLNAPRATEQFDRAVWSGYICQTDYTVVCPVQYQQQLTQSGSIEFTVKYGRQRVSCNSNQTSPIPARLSLFWTCVLFFKYLLLAMSSLFLNVTHNLNCGVVVVRRWIHYRHSYRISILVSASTLCWFMNQLVVLSCKSFLVTFKIPSDITRRYWLHVGERMMSHKDEWSLRSLCWSLSINH